MVTLYRNIIMKVIVLEIKNTILDYGIITEIDGIGRFAIILFGTLFSVVSCLVSF